MALLASVASPRPLAGTHIRTLMDRALWARFGEATLKALQYTGAGLGAVTRWRRSERSH